MKKKELLEKLGLLGVLSFLSYTLAVVFSPLAYPGYNWMAQAVSDLSADSAPSRVLWGQLSSFYGSCGLVSVMAVVLATRERKERTLKVGVTLFAAMEWVSAVGYSAFPLSEAGSPSGFQNVMHLVVTALVVLLSIVSLILIFLGARKSSLRSLGIWALVAFLLMLLGAIGVNALPAAYFGIPERFSVFAAAGFNMVLGLYLFFGRYREA